MNTRENADQKVYDFSLLAIHIKWISSPLK